ncbi:unnamed protein product [Symbiodinium necroappetens]|uniref:Uncharacterized protein n=1 Tax=Symbiodinium necroappetens TaxID=1628268 RepID=A0A813AUM1_9DINO|nr:unnamed protein product [Symbiodinium necroappetens]
MSQAQRAELSIVCISMRSPKGSEPKMELSEENDTLVQTASESKAAMQAYRDMTVYPETDDEVNGVGGLHSGLQARAQVICCGATNTVASQGTLLPSLIAVPAGYFFVASPPASHQDTSSDSVHAAEAVSVHYTCRPACTCWPQRTQNAEWPFARLSVTPASRPAGRTPFTFPAGLKLATSGRSS